MSDLVVQLGAKLDKFAADMNEAGDIADRAVSDIESKFASLNPTMGGFSTLGVAAVGVTGIVGSLLASLVKVNSELADLQRNAEYAGVTAERFQRIQYAAGQGGVSSKDSADDIRNVARLLADAKENENSLTRLLEANNIKYKDRNGQVIKLNDLLTIAGGLLNKFDSMPEKVKAAQMLGLSEQWVEALRNGSAAFEGVAADADRAGAIIDDATVAKAALFDKAWNQSSANLALQFKSVTADIAIWLDGLIDKANELVTAALASQDIKPGSGQEKFNALADAADMLQKDLRGLPQDVDQVTRAIEKLQKSGKPENLEIIAGLELIRAKAELARQMLLQLNQTQAATLFPEGVPTPKARPASADDANPNAAKLPVRGRGGETADAFDRASESIAKHTARLDADTMSVGKGKAAQEELRAETQLFAAAQQAGIPITEKMRDKIQDLAQDAGDAAQALAKAKAASEIEFGRKTAFLSPDDVAIARQLKDIFGNDIPAALQSSYAEAIRWNDTLKGISTTMSSNLTTGLADILDGTKSVSDGFSAMGKSIIRAMEEAIIKMMIVGPLMRSMQGFLGGIGGAIGIPSLSLPKMADGGVIPPGGLALVSEHSPGGGRIIRAGNEPITVTPNNVTQSGGGNTSIVINNNTPSQVQAREVVDGRGNRSIQVTVDEMVASSLSRPGSAARGAMRNNYGANPVGVRR